MNKYKEALQKIHDIIEADALGTKPTKHNDCYYDLLQQLIPVIDEALQSESEKTYTQAEWDIQVKFATDSYERGWNDHQAFIYAMNPSLKEKQTPEPIQSLQPKTEEVKPKVFPRFGEMIPDFVTPSNATDSKQDLLGQAGIIGAANLMFNQPKEQPTSPSIEKVEVWMPTIWSAPNQVVNKYGRSVQGVESVEGYFLTEEEYAQLKANNSLGELEKWAEDKSYGYYHRETESINMMELMNKIEELKDKQ